MSPLSPPLSGGSSRDQTIPACFGYVPQYYPRNIQLQMWKVWRLLLQDLRKWKGSWEKELSGRAWMPKWGRAEMEMGGDRWEEVLAGTRSMEGGCGVVWWGRARVAGDNCYWVQAIQFCIRLWTLSSVLWTSSYKPAWSSAFLWEFVKILLLFSLSKKDLKCPVEWMNFSKGKHCYRTIEKERKGSGVTMQL